MTSALPSPRTLSHLTPYRVCGPCATASITHGETLSASVRKAGRSITSASSPPNPSTQSRSPSSSPQVSNGRAAALFERVGASGYQRTVTPGELVDDLSGGSPSLPSERDANVVRTRRDGGERPAPLSNRTHSDDRSATPTSRLGAGRGE